MTSIRRKTAQSKGQSDTLEDAQEIITQGRLHRGKPARDRDRAVDAVRNKLPIIRQLRAAGHKQEDAVILILELTDDAHRPDTIRKAIAAVLGPWHADDCVSSNNGNVGAPRGPGALRGPGNPLEEERGAKVETEAEDVIEEEDYL